MFYGCSLGFFVKGLSLNPSYINASYQRVSVVSVAGVVGVRLRTHHRHPLGVVSVVGVVGVVGVAGVPARPSVPHLECSGPLALLLIGFKVYGLWLFLSFLFVKGLSLRFRAGVPEGQASRKPFS